MKGKGNTMEGLMLHCGANEVNRGVIDMIPVPTHTDTWKPVAYGDMIDYTRTRMERLHGFELESESYGVTKDGSKFFGLLTYDTGKESSGLSIGLRGSYDKSIAPAGVVGSQVFVCDNLCFSGSGVHVVRKNTKNVWGDLTRLFDHMIDSAYDIHAQMERECDVMKGIPCHLERGYAMLGVMTGRGLLSPRQASTAFGDWTNPRHAEFAERNVWGLYNAVTEGLKKGALGRTIDRHVGAHGFFQQVIA